ncbi:MAG: phage shock protein PspC [Pseudonocardiales bacterium]|nr:phage shock protein PspC [Pseudonocardiales bacterium]
MTDTSRTDTAPNPGSAPAQVLRRSKDDRVGAGVAGGLGRFFGVDPIIFRVLFVALTFMGLAGVVFYLICYAVIPEEGAVNSKLDRAVARLRARGVPIWAAVICALVILWVCLLSWWSPVPFSAIVVIAVVIGVALTRMRSNRPVPAPWPQSPTSAGAAAPSSPTLPYTGESIWAATAANDAPTVSLSKLDDASPPMAAAPPMPAETTTVLPTASEQLREWWGETQTASKARGRRGWITEAVAYTLLGTVWLILGLVSLGSAIPVQAFLWSGFGIVLGCMLIGALLRRPRWRMIVGVLFLTALILVIGTYPVRVGDPTGQQTSAPSTVAEIDGTYRMLGGEQMLDLSDVDFSDRTVTVRINHGAGHVRVTVPDDVDLVLDAKARYGEIVAFDRQAEGLHNQIQLTDLGSDGRGGGTLRLTVDLLAGQIEIVRGATRR